MRRLLFACGAVLLSCRPTPAVAQTGPQPTLILTLFGGASTGHDLWYIGRQPLCTLSTCDNLAPQYDTLELTRNISASIVFGAAGTYFKSPHVGIEGEVFFLGLPFDDSCRPVYLNADPNSTDQQVCDNISAASLSTSAISFYGGLVFRASPRHAISPYVRAGLGIVAYSGGTIEMSGTFTDATGTLFSRSVIDDPRHKPSSFSLTTAVGFTTRLSPGYQFRLEAHDVIISLQRAAGPAGPNLQPPKATRLYHHLILTMGLDVVLEQRRGRRY